MAYYKLLPYNSSVYDYDNECIVKIDPIKAIDLASVKNGEGFSYFKTGIPSFTSQKDLVRYSVNVGNDNEWVCEIWTKVMIDIKKMAGFLGIRVMRRTEYDVDLEIWAQAFFPGSNLDFIGGVKKITSHTTAPKKTTY